MSKILKTTSIITKILQIIYILWNKYFQDYLCSMLLRACTLSHHRAIRLQICSLAPAGSFCLCWAQCKIWTIRHNEQAKWKQHLDDILCDARATKDSKRRALFWALSMPRKHANALCLFKQSYTLPHQVDSLTFSSKTTMAPSNGSELWRSKAWMTFCSSTAEHTLGKPMALPSLNPPLNPPWLWQIDFFCDQIFHGCTHTRRLGHHTSNLPPTSLNRAFSNHTQNTPPTGIWGPHARLPKMAQADDYIAIGMSLRGVQIPAEHPCKNPFLTIFCELMVLTSCIMFINSFNWPWSILMVLNVGKQYGTCIWEKAWVPLNWFTANITPIWSWLQSSLKMALIARIHA